METMAEYGFVVLHYMAYEMTLQCTESLLDLSATVHVVIVDNASPNGSGEKLQSHFRGNPAVTVLLNARNEGFAKGNNRGYKYMKEHFPCSFITVLNNDVLIQDKDFPAKVGKIYERTPFAVLGPDILNPSSGIHQNPAHEQGFTVRELEGLIGKQEERMHHFRWKRFKWRIKRALHLSPVPPAPVFRTEPLENVVLHGACYVFSKDFLANRENAFNPDTFLYFEEDILHFECMRDRLILRYDPSIQVIHLEDVSTDAAFRRASSKEIMKLKETVRSIRVLLNLMKS